MRWTRFAVVVVVPGVVLGLSKVHAAYVAAPEYDFTASSRLAWSVTYAAMLLIGSYIVGLPGLVEGPRTALSASLGAILAGVAVISGAQLALGDALLPRFVVFGAGVALIPLLTVIGSADVRGRRRIAQRDRVFFVGGVAEARLLASDIERDAECPAVLVGAATVDDLDVAPLAGLIAAANATLLVLDVGAQGTPAVVSQAAVEHERGMRVRTLSLFYEQWLAKLPLSELERVSLLFDVGELHRARYARFKRLFDLAIGAVGLVALAVVTPAVLLGNLAANRGPLLFRQERVGKAGEVFTILKFRTMDPGPNDGLWTAEDDPRITPLGRYLRRFHIDELPQMVNVVRGDLSLVGPRPEQPQYVEQLTESLPFYRLRHLVRPGLTGWAQVKFGYAGDERDALHKLQYEFFYLRHQGLSFDLRILGRTARSIVVRGGR